MRNKANKLRRTARAGQELFDASWYAEKYGPNVDRSSAWRHYQKIGRFVGARPNPLFDPAWYSREYKAGSVANALMRFSTVGVERMHSPSPLFESEWYAHSNPDVVQAGVSPLAHYVGCGRHEGRSPASWCQKVSEVGTARDLRLASDFALEDLVGYFPDYYVAETLVSEPDVSAFLELAAPRWVFGRLPSRHSRRLSIDQAIVVGGRREVLTNGDIYTTAPERHQGASHRAFAVTYSVSPVLSNAIHALGAAPAAFTRCVPSDGGDGRVPLLVDVNVSRAQRDRLRRQIASSVEPLSLRRGAMCRVRSLRFLDDLSPHVPTRSFGLALSLGSKVARVLFDVPSRKP